MGEKRLGKPTHSPLLQAGFMKGNFCKNKPQRCKNRKIASKKWNFCDCFWNFARKSPREEFYRIKG